MNRSLIFLTSLLILMSSFQAFSFQKVDELLADPDITWVGEVYVDYLPNTTISEPVNLNTEKCYGTVNYNSFEILKLHNKAKDESSFKLLKTLSDRLFHLSPKNLNVYKDADLKEKLNYEAYQKAAKNETVDTIITFDPETFEEIVQVIVWDIAPEDVFMFRVKQIISYNAKKNQLKVIPIAIAPIGVTYDNPNNCAGLHKDVLFWMPIKEAFANIDLGAPSIDWAKRLTKDIPSKDVNVLKGTGTLSSLFDKMIVQYRKNASTAKLYHSYLNRLTPWLPEEIEKLGVSLDTVITFDPETYKEIPRVLNRSLPPLSFTKIRIQQDWIWDNKAQEMQIRWLGFSPAIRKIYGSIEHRPMYYIKSGE